jgi:hypothetical protein
MGKDILKMQVQSVVLFLISKGTFYFDFSFFFFFDGTFDLALMLIF